MRPAWTDAEWPSTTPFLTVAQARAWVGLYGDSGVDAELQVCVDAAVEAVAEYVGFRITDTKVTDWYGPLDGPRELRLSEPGVDPAGLVVTYTAPDGTDTALAADEWELVTGVQEWIVRVLVDPDVHRERRNPWRVSYKSKLSAVRGIPVSGRVAYAVRLVLARMWQDRGQSAAAGAAPMDSQVISRRALEALIGAAVPAEVVRARLAPDGDREDDTAG